MSTRATYQFNNGDSNSHFKTLHTVYIHHDGYHSGAASYFYAALMHPSRCGGLVDAFIRANDGAELTKSHEIHGDTEYRYYVEGDGPTAMLRVSHRVNFSEEWAVGYLGKLYEFITANPEFIDPFHPFKIVTVEYSKQCLNLVTAGAILNSEHGALDSLRVWSKNGACTRNSANWKSQASRMAALVEAFPELLTEEIKALIEVDATATA